MELILDTCGLLSLVGLVERRLSEETLLRLQSATLVGLSACSLFEIGIKNKKGNLPVDPFQSPQNLWTHCLTHYELTEIPVDAQCFGAAVELPNHHADPFDRIILASAIREGAGIVTFDALFERYGVEVIS